MEWIVLSTFRTTQANDWTIKSSAEDLKCSPRMMSTVDVGKGVHVVVVIFMASFTSTDTRV